MREPRGQWFRTATGRKAWVLDPQTSEVSIQDIAISLSRQCRFAGHLREDVEHYSVAQHSVLVSCLVPPELALVGLLHDASEAYTQDVIRPLKAEIADVYAPIERAWALRVGEFFGLGNQLAELPRDVKYADAVALATELRDLLIGREWSLRAPPCDLRIVPLDSRSARDAFLARFRELLAGHPLAQVT